MRIEVEWADGRPDTRYVNIERVSLIEYGLAQAGVPETNVLYVNPQAARSIRVVDEQETLGEELIGILAEHVGERGQSEGAIEVLHRIIRERDDARARVASQDRLVAAHR